METSPGKYKRSKLGTTIRFATLFLLVSMALIFFSPELFHNKTNFHFTYELERYPINDMSFQSRILLLVIIEISFIILGVGLFAVAKIFDMLINEQWFLPRFSKLLKTFGITLIIFTLLPLITDPLVQLAMKIKNISFDISIHTDNSLLIIIGILLISVARVLSKASKNAQDLEQII